MKLIHKILLLFTLVLFNSSGLAQNNSIKWSSALEIPKSEDIVDFILVEDTIPALISKYGEAIIMRSFTDPAQEFPLFIRTDQDQTLEQCHVINDRLFTLESQIKDEKTEYKLVVYQLKSSRADRVIERVVSPNKKFSLNTTRPVFFSASKDGQQILLCQQKSYEKQSTAQFNLIVSGENSSENIALPSEFDSDDVELLGAAIDNSGIVYFATETGIKLNSPFRKKYLVYSYHPESKTLTEFDLTSNEFFILDLIVTTSQENAMISCLYSTEPLVEDKSTGYTFVQLSKDGKEVKTRLAATFNNQIIAQFGEDEGGIKNIKDLFLVTTIQTETETWVAMEKRYKSRICTADPHTGIMTCTDQFHFNAVAFENVFNNEKTVSVNKRQIDYDSPSIFTKQALVQHNKDIFMFYNDHFKNVNTSNDFVMSNTNRSIMKYARINGSDNATSGTLGEGRQSDFVFVPALGAPQFGNITFLLAADGKFYRYGKLDLNQLHEAK